MDQHFGYVIVTLILQLTKLACGIGPRTSCLELEPLAVSAFICVGKFLIVATVFEIAVLTAAAIISEILLNCEGVFERDLLRDLLRLLLLRER